MEILHNVYVLFEREARPDNRHFQGFVVGIFMSGHDAISSLKRQAAGTQDGMARSGFNFVTRGPEPPTEWSETVSNRRHQTEVYCVTHPEFSRRYWIEIYPLLGSPLHSLAEQAE